MIAMMRQIIITLTALLLFGCSKEGPKKEDTKSVMPQQTRQTTPNFDGKRAFDYLVAQTKFGPRVPGSKAHDKCLNYLLSEMQKYADAVNPQQFSHTGYDGKNLSMTNIISSFNLKAESRILFVAHWDSRPMADQDPDPKKRNLPVLGANDGASGVAVLMEMAVHLKESPPSVGVDMLFTDGEDYGKEGDNQNYLLGARYFAQHKPEGFKPLFGILLDMVGDKELEIPKDQYSIRFAPDIVELVWSTAHELGVSQFTDGLQGYVMDDHLPLNDVGIKTIDLIDFDYPDETNRYWHTTEDTPDKCDPASLSAVGEVLMHVIYQYQPL
jgi:Peptidase family M28